MKKFLQGGRRFIFDPIRLIEITIATLALIGAVYVFTPLYEISVIKNGLSPFASALSGPYVVASWAAVIIVSSLLVLVGLYNRLPQLKSVGWFGLFLARIFQVSVTILSTGLLPSTWLFPFTIALISLILWVNARVEVLRSYAVS